MNITKTMLMTCIFFNISSNLFASQANFEAAFKAVGGGSDAKVAAQKIKKNAVSGQTAYGQVKGLNTPEAWAVGKYVANGNDSLFKTTITEAQVEAAIAVTLGGAAASTGTDTKSEKTSSGSTGGSTSGSTNSSTSAPTDTVASAMAALKTEIDNAITTYNAAVTGSGQKYKLSNA